MVRKLFDKSSTLEKRRLLKFNQTEAESLLWSKLRNRQFHNLKFRRQFGIGEYVADFYCPEIKLVIELDGSQHYTDEGLAYDKIRTEFMECMNIRVARFSNLEVLRNIDGVLLALEDITKV